MLNKGGLKAGDALVLTKPLGFGVTTTALKQQKADEEDVLEAVMWMKRLNKTAGQLANEFHLRAGTDITGYSLLGHGMEMAEASGVSLRLDFAGIPFISGARKYAKRGIFPGGAFDNKNHFESKVEFADSIEESDRMLLFDAQTSGGLLLGVPPEKLDVFLRRAREMDQALWVIGSVEGGRGIKVIS
jgi:selenide,water dikinase